MKTLFLLFLTLIVLALMPSCIEDSIDTSPSSQPEFSVDTLKMGVIFTDQPTPTHRFLVYNRHDKVMSISNISLRSGQKIFRMNVDGFSGETFQNIEIRPNDSIFVFVEATVPQSGTPALTPTTDYIDFTTNGVTRSILLLAEAQDVERRHGLVITEDSRWDATYPYQIFDSLVVDHGVTLTLSEGTALHFHDKAYMRIYGSLVTEGTPQNPVNLSGDRTDNVVGDISFDLMASQWDRLEFAPESKGNRLSHTVIRNTSNGVIADSLSQVTFLNCRLRNSADYSLVSRYADVSLYGCELAEASNGVLALMGGKLTANHCTFANYYLFSGLRGASIQFFHFSPDSDNESGMPYLTADFANSIFYGNGTDLSEGDFTGTDIYFNRCLFKSAGNDDDNFINSIWNTDPLYYTVRNDYYFDYRLQPDSPARGVADPTLTATEAAYDFYGTPRLPYPHLGAYQTDGDAGNN